LASENGENALMPQTLTQDSYGIEQIIQMLVQIKECICSMIGLSETICWYTREIYDSY
jgi:hypothetical protein